MDQHCKSVGNYGMKFKVVEENKTVYGEMFTTSCIVHELINSLSSEELEIMRVVVGDDYFKFKTFAAKATCQSPDEFNPEVGMNIAEAKMRAKDHAWRQNVYTNAVQKLVKLATKLEELDDRHYRKEVAIRHDFNEYYCGGEK